jgi:hypothetical protein
MAIDPDLGKVGTGQLQFEYTVDNKATSRTFWDLSMIDGYIVQQPPPTVRPSPIPNKPGNIFHGHHVTITPRGNVEAGKPLSKSSPAVELTSSLSVIWISEAEEVVKIRTMLAMGHA